MLHCPTCGREFAADLTRCPDDDTYLQVDATIAEPPIDPLIGRTLDDKYRLESRLGVGGMGTVYRAKHLLIDRAVAVKVLNQRFVEDEAAKTRFRREAKASGRLQHANAVGVTDFGETADGRVYIVMELLEGQTLRDVLAKEAPLEVARTVSMMLQVASAVAAAHEAGIIHRDLKPANIFIVQRPDVPAVLKVLDFGIAKLATDTLDEDDRQTLTQVGAIIGTPRYMSPEQCSGQPLTPAADVYSLGVILFEMLTGTVPFNGPSPVAIAVKHTTEQPRKPSEFVSSIPAALEKVVLHALEKKPVDRPADAAAFRRELYETAEQLGLEHAAASTAPSIEALRSAGTQSPSGRLVIDLGRLRENRAATSGAGELRIINDADAETVLSQVASVSGSRVEPTQVEPILVDKQNTRAKRSKPFLLVAVLTLILVIVGVGFLALRSRGTPPAGNPNAVSSPTPAKVEPTPAKAEASPAASVAPTSSPAAQASPTIAETKQPDAKKQTNKNENKNDNKNNNSKGGFFHRLKEKIIH